jgi:hypothetical protein
LAFQWRQKIVQRVTTIIVARNNNRFFNICNRFFHIFAKNDNRFFNICNRFFRIFAGNDNRLFNICNRFFVSLLEMTIGSSITAPGSSTCLLQITT